MTSENLFLFFLQRKKKKDAVTKSKMKVKHRLSGKSGPTKPTFSMKQTKHNDQKVPFQPWIKVFKKKQTTKIIRRRRRS